MDKNTDLKMSSCRVFHENLSDILQNSFQRTQGAYTVFFNTHSKRALCNLCKIYMRWYHGKKISKKFKKKRLFTLEIIIVTVWCSEDGFNHVRTVTDDITNCYTVCGTVYWHTHVNYMQHILFVKERLWSNCDPQANFFTFRQWKFWYFWSSDVSQFCRSSHLCWRLTIHHIFLYLCRRDRRSGRLDHATFLMQWKNICWKSWDRNVLLRLGEKDDGEKRKQGVPRWIFRLCSSNFMELFVKHK